MSSNVGVADRPGGSSESLPSLTVRLQFEGVNRADFSLEEVTKRLDMEPSESFRRGEPRHHQSPLNPGIATHARDVWLYRVGPEDTLDLRPLLQVLKRDISVKPHEIKAMCADLGIEAFVMVGISILNDGSWPICVFPPDFLSWMSDIGASLDVDLI